MKFTKTEKIWLFTVVFFYVAYNLPWIPSYNHPIATIVHAVITLLPLWVSVYIGLVKISSSYDRFCKEEDKEKSSC